VTDEQTSTDTSLQEQDSGSPIEEATPTEEATTAVDQQSTEIPATDQQSAATSPQENTIESLPVFAQEVIRKLRKENASRRTENTTLTNQNETLTGLVQQVAEQIPQSEQASGETPPTSVPETPDAIANVLTTVLDTLGSLSRENVVMRVVNETGLPMDLVQNMNGDTYETLSTQAKAMAEYARTTQGASPVPPPPKVPKAPSGDEAVGITDADRQQRYFGGGNSDAGVFASGGGVKYHSVNS